MQMVSKEALKSAVREYTTNPYTIIAVDAIIDSINDVDAEPVKHGHWILLKENTDGNQNNDYECSVCHAGETHSIRVDVPYCWKCGAKMDEERSDD